MKASKSRIGLLLWLPVLIWMTLIFYLSSETADQSSALSGGIIQRAAEWIVPGFEEMPADRQEEIIGNFQFAVRKTGHVTEYVILGALVITALFQYTLRPGKRFILAVCIGLLYAVSDEVHQLFIAGRSGRITDVLFDLSGVLIGTFLISMLGNAIKRKREKVRRV